MALGKGSLTVEEQATTYATFANGGECRHPARGRADHRATAPCTPLKSPAARCSPRTRPAESTAALLADVTDGTGYPTAVLPDGRPIIGKTGTTNNAQSAFFIGAIPQYTLAVGMFTRTSPTTPPRRSTTCVGQRAARRLRRRLAHDDLAQRSPSRSSRSLPIEQFPVPAIFPGSQVGAGRECRTRSTRSTRAMARSSARPRRPPGPGPGPPPALPAVRRLQPVPEPEPDPDRPVAFADPGPELLVRPVLRRLPAPRRWRHRRRRPGGGQPAVPGTHTLAVADFHAVRSGPGWSPRPGRARGWLLRVSCAGGGPASRRRRPGPGSRR